MTDRAQFEAMLEALINEDQETAKEIFHNIVVGKSREIYEELLESDFGGSEEEEDSESPFAGTDDDSAEDADSEEDDASEEDEFGSEEDDDESEDEFGSEDESEGDYEDRILDIEDEIDEINSILDKFMAGEKNEPEHDDMFGADSETDEFDSEDEFGSELGDDDTDVKEVHITHSFDKSQGDKEFQEFMEYITKVSPPIHKVDNGVQKKSVVDNMKNDMGGKVIGRSSDETTGGTEGGLLNPTTSELNTKNKNVNVPGNKKAPSLKPVSKGHGAERKGTSSGTKAYGPISGK